MTKRSFSNMIVVAAAMILILGVQTSAQVKQGKERPLLTKSWMAEINQPHCARLGEILQSGPSSDKEWAEAARHAELLNEAGHTS